MHITLKFIGEADPGNLDALRVALATVHSSVPVVIASRGSEGITRSGILAIVPYGSGEIVIRRQQGKQAEVISHYFGDSAVPGKASVEGGLLRITTADRDSAGKPLEWIEVRIS